MLITPELQRKREAIASLYPKGREVLIINGSSSYYNPYIPLVALSDPNDLITLHHEFAHHYYRRFLKEIIPPIKRYKGRDKLMEILNIFEDAFIERNHPYLPHKRFVEHAHRLTEEKEKTSHPIPFTFPYTILIWHYDLRRYYNGVPQNVRDYYYEHSENLYNQYEELRLAFENNQINIEPILKFLLQFLTDEEKEIGEPEKTSQDDNDIPPPPPFDYDEGDEDPEESPNPFYGSIADRDYVTPEEYEKLSDDEKKTILERGIGVGDSGESNLEIKVITPGNLMTDKGKERHYGYGLRIDTKKLSRWKRKISMGGKPNPNESPLYRWKDSRNQTRKLVLIIDTSTSMNSFKGDVNNFLEKLHIQFDVVIEFNSSFFIRNAPNGKKLIVRMARASGGTVFPSIQLPDADEYTFIVITDGGISNPNDMLNFKGRHKTVFVLPETIVKHFQSIVPHITPYITIEKAVKNPSRLKELLS